MIIEALEKVRYRAPLVFSLTNFVTVNDCANILLAAGASPVMSLDPREAADLARAASAVVINFGTPSPESVEAMLLAGKAANAANVPVLLDPVGAGATPLRMEIAQKLLCEIHFAAIRGNASEIRALTGKSFDGKGVDAGQSEVETMLQDARELAGKYQTVVGVSGAVDVIASDISSAKVYNGNEKMPAVTGSGCMESALGGAFLGANPEIPFEALLATFVTTGVAGELAAARLLPGEGNASYRNRLIDAVNLLNAMELKERANYEIL